MEIIPVLDLLDDQVVKATKGNRSHYRPIDKKIYNTTDPISIVSQIVSKYQPTTIYVADLSAIIKGKVNHSFFQLLFEKFQNVNFWIDTGLNNIKLVKNYSNYFPIFCSENSKGFELLSNKYSNHICSLDFKGRLLGAKQLHRFSPSLPKKIILMDLLRIGSNSKPNFHLLKNFIRKNDDHQYYVAGGIKSLLDIKKSEQLGATGVLVSTIIHRNVLNKLVLKKNQL